MEETIIKRALDEMNEDRVREFKNKVAATLKQIVDDQKALATLLKRIEDNKKLLKEMKLEQLDANEVL